jgi:hypothetical protein
MKTKLKQLTTLIFHRLNLLWREISAAMTVVGTSIFNVATGGGDSRYDSKRVFPIINAQNNNTHRSTYPKVVIVTMVYQKAAGMDVKLVSCSFFSA